MVTNPLRWTTRDLDAMPDKGGWNCRTEAQLQLVATLLEGDILRFPLLPGYSTAIAQIFL